MTHVLVPGADAAHPRGLLGDGVEDPLGRDPARHQDGHFAQRSLGIHPPLTSGR